MEDCWLLQETPVVSAVEEEDADFKEAVALSLQLGAQSTAQASPSVSSTANIPYPTPATLDRNEGVCLTPTNARIGLRVTFQFLSSLGELGQQLLPVANSVIGDRGRLVSAHLQQLSGTPGTLLGWHAGGQVHGPAHGISDGYCCIRFDTGAEHNLPMEDCRLLPEQPRQPSEKDSPEVPQKGIEIEDRDPDMKRALELSLQLQPKGIEEIEDEDPELLRALELSLQTSILTTARDLLRHETIEKVDMEYVARCTENWAQSRVLGSGAFAVVYQGMDAETDPASPFKFAAKKPSRKQGEGLTDNVDMERMMLERITFHPNIIRLLGFATSDDTTVLCFEYAERGSLESHLQKDDLAASLPWATRASITCGLASAIQHLHEGLCFHRDIKPGNIVLMQDLTPKLIDFGLATRFEAQEMAVIVSDDAPLGTQGFMCKQYTRTFRFEPKSEVYSVGITILQIVTGQTDFTHESLLDSLDCLEADEQDEAASAIALAHDRRIEEVPSVVEALAQMAAMAAVDFSSRALLGPLCVKAQAVLDSLRTSTSLLALQSDRVEAVDMEYVAHCTNSWAADRELGQGAFGIVYLGKDADFPFAAKLLKCHDELNQARLKQMTEAEITALTKFQHPNIIRLLGFSKARDNKSMALLYEYEEQGSLERHLREEKLAQKLGWPARARIIQGLVKAIVFLHGPEDVETCYHRDVKPGNLVLSEDFCPKLIDCGLSRFLPPGEKELKALSTCGVLGTPGFLCPRYMQTGKFEEKSEVYAVGVTILQTVTGLLDFPDGGTLSKLVDAKTLSQEHFEKSFQARDKRPEDPEDCQNLIRDLGKMGVCAAAVFKKRWCLKELREQVEGLDPEVLNSPGHDANAANGSSATEPQAL